MSFAYIIDYWNMCFTAVRRATLLQKLIMQSILPTIRVVPTVYLRDALRCFEYWSRSYSNQTCTKSDCIKCKNKPPLPGSHAWPGYRRNKPPSTSAGFCFFCPCTAVHDRPHTIGPWMTTLATGAGWVKYQPCRIGWVSGVCQEIGNSLHNSNSTWNAVLQELMLLICIQYILEAKQKQTPCPLQMSAGLTVESQPTMNVNQHDCGIKENKAHLLHASAFWGAKEQRTLQRNLKCVYSQHTQLSWHLQ